jgi:integrase
MAMTTDEAPGAPKKPSRQNLDDRLADDASGPPPDVKLAYVIHWDADIKGLGLRVTRKGAKSWVLVYRAAGTQRCLTIGTHRDPWRVAAVRKEALRLKVLIDQGRDPMGERHLSRTAPRVNDLIERWREEHAPKNRASSTRENERLIAQWIKPELGTKRVADVTFEDVDKLHRKISQKQGTPYRANRVVALLSKMFSLALKWRMTRTHPCKGIERNREQPRATYLEPDQLERLLAALDDHPNKAAANAIRLLVLTGARSAEVFSASWKQFDLKADGTWTKPAAGTKGDKEHRVPLSPEALELLAEIRKTTSSVFVFPGLRTVRHDWAAICKVAGIEGIRVHDLRHSFASFLASSGLSLPIIGALLGHTQAQTTMRYAHLLDGPLRDATAKVGAIVTKARRSDATANSN